MGYEYATGITLPLITLAAPFGSVVALPDNVIDNYIEKLYKSWSGAVDKEVWEHEFNQMITGIEKGYGIPFSDIQYGHEDWEYIQNLKYNTAVFDAFKQNNETVNLQKLLYKDGKLIPFKEFKELALKEAGKYNLRWLQTEYNHAHQSALMARKWRKFEANADLYPNLKFIAVLDERTRHSHRALNGKVYPINHSFWNIYYPPLDYNCRCTARSTSEGVSENLPEKLPVVPEGLRVNTGKTAQLFDSSHTYYKVSDKATKAKIMSFVRSNIRPAKEVEKGYNLFNSAGNKYEKYFFNGDTGGFVISDKSRIAQTVSKNDKAIFNKELNMAKIAANNGQQLTFIPELTGKPIHDANLTNGLKIELKKTGSHNNIRNYTKEAIVKQADVVLFEFDTWNEAIKRNLFRTKQAYQDKIKVWYLKDGNLYK